MSSGGEGGGKKRRRLGIELSLEKCANDSISMEGPIGDPVSIRSLQAKHCRTGVRCWGCENAFGEEPNKRERPLDWVLWDTYRRLRKTASTEYMYEQLSRTQIESIAKVVRANGFECIDWLPDMVRTHIEHHMDDPIIERRRTFRTLRLLEEEAANLCVVVVDGKRTVNPDAVDALEKLTKMKLTVMKSEGE